MTDRGKWKTGCNPAILEQLVGADVSEVERLLERKIADVL